MPMSKGYQEKPDFMIDQGLCYHTLHLKNALTMCHRSMDEISTLLIIKNIEVQIDNMIIKGKQGNYHNRDLEETLKVFTNYDMKLNPKKCVLGLDLANSWDPIVNQRGINLT